MRQIANNPPVFVRFSSTDRSPCDLARRGSPRISGSAPRVLGKRRSYRARNTRPGLAWLRFRGCIMRVTRRAPQDLNIRKSAVTSSDIDRGWRDRGTRSNPVTRRSAVKRSRCCPFISAECSPTNSSNLHRESLHAHAYPRAIRESSSGKRA